MATTHPIAQCVESYSTQREPFQRLDAMLLAFEVMIRFDALLLARHVVESSECRDDKARALLLLRKFQLGNWYSLLQTLASVLPEPRPPEAEWFLRLERGKKPTLQRLLPIRNLRAHDERRTQPEFVAGLLERGEPLFERAVETHPELGALHDAQRGDRKSVV